ncbi:hypothetical protein Emag_007416 [Eimeria magna]
MSLLLLLLLLLLMLLLLPHPHSMMHLSVCVSLSSHDNIDSAPPAAAAAQQQQQQQQHQHQQQQQQRRAASLALFTTSPCLVSRLEMLLPLALPPPSGLPFSEPSCRKRDSVATAHADVSAAAAAAAAAGGILLLPLFCAAASACRLWAMVLVCSTGILLIAKPGLMSAALGGGTTTAETSVNEAGIIEDLSKGGAVIILVTGAFLHGVSFVLGRHVATRAPPILSIVLMMLFGLVSFLPLVCIVSPFQLAFFQSLNGGHWVALAGEGFNAASLGGAALIVCSAIVLAFYSIRKGIRRDRLAAANAAAAEAEEEAKAAETGSAAAAEVGAAAAAAVAAPGTDAATADPDRSSDEQASPRKEAQLQLTGGDQAVDRLSPLSSSSNSSNARSSSSCCSSKSSSKNKTRSSSSRHSQRQQPAAANAAESDTDFS